MKKRVLVWDLVGTLWQHKKEQIEILAKDLNIPYTEELKNQFFYMIQMFHSLLLDKRLTKDLVSSMISDTMPILRKYGISGNQFLDIWNKSDCNYLTEDARNILDITSGIGYKNIVLTDWWFERQFKQLLFFEILDYIEEIYAVDGQYQKACTKSFSRLYIKNPSDYIMIGDSIPSDIAYAKNVGIDSIWYNKKGIKNVSSIIPTYEVRDLMSILDYI